jgi:acetyl-CoA synthetase
MARPGDTVRAYGSAGDPVTRTAWPAIRKGRWPAGVTPHIVDLADARARFTWDDARASLDGLPGGRGLNIAHEAVDRHAASDRRDRVAVRWIRRDGRVEASTYRELRASTNRFAHVLEQLGVGPGERVFTLLGRVPALHVAVLGTLKHRSVVCPLFPAFGPEPVRQRLALGETASCALPTAIRDCVAVHPSSHSSPCSGSRPSA